MFNEKADIGLWKHDIDPMMGDFSTFGCRLEIGKASSPIIKAREQERNAVMANRIEAK